MNGEELGGSELRIDGEHSGIHGYTKAEQPCPFRLTKNEIEGEPREQKPEDWRVQLEKSGRVSYMEGIEQSGTGTYACGG